MLRSGVAAYGGAMSFGSLRNLLHGSSISRRDLFREGVAAASFGLCRPRLFAATAPLAPVPARDIYASLGVRPIINCDHVKTILGGSLVLPEVMQAMEGASHHFVQFDELMDAVGARLAELT